MPVIALGIISAYPWEATIALIIIFTLAPFMMARYRATGWRIPSRHALLLLVAGVILVYFYFRYEQSVHYVELLSYLWENDQLEPRIATQGSGYSALPVEYSSAREILPEFLLLTCLPALASLALSSSLYWVRKVLKKRRTT